ncbi:MAG TPA: hypothetical protein VM077_05680 [Candidatus Limnocylindrales bacterium]|nr:hypothetical protein [Candidatus Limnocylindrales bacterium]
MTRSELKPISGALGDPSVQDEPIERRVLQLPSPLLIGDPGSYYGFALRNHATGIINFLVEISNKVATRDVENPVIATYTSRPIRDAGRELEYNTQLAKALVVSSVDQGIGIEIEVEDTQGNVWKRTQAPESHTLSHALRVRFNKVRRKKKESESASSPLKPTYKLKIDTQQSGYLEEFITHTISIVEPLSFS